MAHLIARYHLHPLIDHFTVALLSAAVIADILASLLSILRAQRERASAQRDHLAATALYLMVAGAMAVILSRYTGESEAERLWDGLPTAAQQLLWSDAGPRQLLGHAILGTYLMYGFVTLAAWRIIQALSPTLARTRPAYLAVVLIFTTALFYQGMTGGELVYDYGVGTNAGSTERAAPAAAPSSADLLRPRRIDRRDVPDGSRRRLAAATTKESREDPTPLTRR